MIVFICSIESISVLPAGVWRDFCRAVERGAIAARSGLDFLLSTVIGLKSAAKLRKWHRHGNVGTPPTEPKTLPSDAGARISSQ